MPPVIRIGKMSLQSLGFSKKEWTKRTAINWLKNRGYKYGKMDSAGNYFWFRQINPDLCKRYATTTWRSRKDAAGRGRRRPKKILARMCRVKGR
jgi:hypothetical protein